jgi:carbon monoxide dehydrogenase subunit G
MKLEQSFEVAAPLETVWEALIDVERVAPCLPGAAVTGRNDDGSYDGTFKVKIGPTSASYAGKLRMEQVDESVHSATMDAQGTDKRGQGGAKATIVSSLSDAGNGSTRVDVSTDYHITGRLARFGRGGMIEDISNRLLGEFAKCLQTNLAGGTGEAVPDAPAAEAGAEASAESEAAAAAAAAGTPTEAGAEAGAASASPGGEVAGDQVAAAGEVAAEQVAAAGEASQQAAAAGEAAPGEAAAAPGTAGPGGPAPGGAAPDGESAPTMRPPFQPMPESEPVQGLSLMASALLGQAKRNPAQVAALILGFLLALRVFRRRS